MKLSSREKAYIESRMRKIKDLDMGWRRLWKDAKIPTVGVLNRMNGFWKHRRPLIRDNE